MAVDRNRPPGTTNTSVGGTSTTTNNSVTNESTSSWQTGSTSSISQEIRNLDFMDPASRRALNQLLAGLTTGSGGNAASQAAQEVDRLRLDEIAANQGIRADYSKGQAFADAQGAMNANLARTLELAMPTITAGIDAAGTSGSALSALLTQQAADDAAASAAELGLQAAISYGNIQASLSQTIGSILGQGSEAANLLMQALGIGKGSMERGTITGTQQTTSSSRGGSTSTSSTSGTSTTTQQQNQSESTTPNRTTGGVTGTSSYSNYY